MNEKAMTSLVLGILSIFLPFLGLITGIMGIIYANTVLSTGEEAEGRNLAISGKVCSIIGLCLQILVIITVILGYLFFTRLIFGYN
ncbi:MULTISPECIES: hypothetical protein [unclassified Halobacillus]|nr:MULTISPECIES: hypothetical protein [unclassified Halobacillus]ELK46422.1 hypothetical protein D479_10621 [Halobacillus sp. BAB-2008]